MLRVQQKSLTHFLFLIQIPAQIFEAAVAQHLPLLQTIQTQQLCEHIYDAYDNAMNQARLY